MSASATLRMGSENRLEYSRAMHFTSTGKRGPHIWLSMVAQPLYVVGSVVLIEHIEDLLELVLHRRVGLLELAIEGPVLDVLCGL